MPAVTEFQTTLALVMCVTIVVAKTMEPGKSSPPPIPGQAVPAADLTEQSTPIPVPRAVRKWLPILKTVGPPLVAMLIAITDARTGKHEVSEKTDTAYETLAPSTNNNSKRIKKIEESIGKLADTVELQGKLLLAMQPGFTTAGTPAPLPTKPPTQAMRREKARHAPPADPALVKKVQAESVKTFQEIKKRAAEPAPAAVTVPATIPAQPPPPVTQPAASPPDAESK